MQKERLVEELTAYAQLKRPGYAVLIDAEWGGGKTFLVKRWMADYRSSIYVSAFGVSSFDQLQAALLEALISNNRRLRTPYRVRKIEGVLKHVSGYEMGLSDVYRRIALQAVPNLIILDDIERSELSANVALGALNEFLEHQGKNVILLTDQKLLQKKWSEDDVKYSDVKEKIVGQVLALSPSFRAVLDEVCLSERGFWNTALDIFRGGHPDKEYLSFIGTSGDRIINIMEASGSRNLRLLRKSLRDFQRIYNVSKEVTHGDREKLESIIGTYMALNIAYNRGGIYDETILEQGSRWDRAVSRMVKHGDPAPIKKPIEVLRDKYSGVREVNLEGLVLTPKLAVGAIAQGNFDQNFVRTELSKSFFLSESSVEAWRVLWYWRAEKAQVGKSALQKVLAEIDRLEIIDPVTILHVFCILRSLEESGVKIGLDRPVIEALSKYLERAEVVGILPKEMPITKYSYSIIELNNTGLGFTSTDQNFFDKAVEAIELTLDRIFWKEIKSNPVRFVSEYKNNFQRLLVSIDNRGDRGEAPNFAHLPVLAYTDTRELVDAMLADGPNNSYTFLSVVADRLDRLKAPEDGRRGNEWPDENEWFKQVIDELRRRSPANAESIEDAQLVDLIDFAESKI